MKKYFIALFILLLTSMGLYCQGGENYNYEYALIEASRQKMIGNVNEAIKLYEKCIEVNPGSGIAHYELGSIYAAFQKDSLSCLHLEKAYSLNRENVWYVTAYNQMLRQSGRYKEARRVLERYYHSHHDLKIRFLIAENYISLKKYKEALKILNDLDRNGFSEKIVLKKLEIFKLTGNVESGIAIIDELIALFPETPEYHLIKGEFLNESGNRDASIQSYLKAYGLDSTNIFAISNLADYYLEQKDLTHAVSFLSTAFLLDEIPVEKKISTLMFILNDKDFGVDSAKSTRKLVDQLLETYPENVDVKLLAYDYYYKNSLLPQAYEILKDIVEVRQDNFMFWQRILVDASILLKYDDLIKYSNEALKFFPNKKEIPMFLGIGQYQMGQYEASLETLSGAYTDTLQLPVKIQFLTFMAEASYKLGMTDSAFRIFDTVLLLDPDNLAILNNYSYYLALANEQLSKALKMSQITINSEPQNATYLDTYAWVLFVNGNASEARKFMEKIIHAGKIDDPDVLFHYAEIMRSLGEYEIARNYYSKARDAGYKNSDLNEILNDL